MLALAVVKVLHELGHALTCKHFGGDCHEIGVLLLFFTPCLYCNVSDAWLFPGKWPRIAVSAAGIAVEVFLAAIATFLWWFSIPGVFNTLCLNIMIVCSLNTLLINGNPLLRYDGYYVLADLLDVPNLGQQSRWLLGRLLAGFFLGSDPPPDRGASQPESGSLGLWGRFRALRLVGRAGNPLVILPPARTTRPEGNRTNPGNGGHCRCGRHSAWKCGSHDA